jgi:putative pyruvate formate lyase activating enzyme
MTVHLPTTSDYEPRYLLAAQSGSLKESVDSLEALLKRCTVCPRDCMNDRTKDEIAACYSGSLPIVSSHTAHFGEEPFLSGTKGAGNIFFGNCNLRCVYCQNYQISQTWKEQRRNEVSHERLAEMMIELQGRGCHNIGFVSPTHFAPQMARAVLIAHKMGLRVPIVYNTNAYDSVEALSHLENVVDIYLPDLKYSSNEDGFTYSKVRSYRDVARSAIREMHRQAGSALIFGEDGLLKRGLVIRLLVLPNDLAGLEENLEWIASELGNDVCISLMAQYYPTNKAATDSRYILMSRRITESEWARAVSSVEKFGFTNGFVQEYESSSFYYRPDFSDSDTPFKDIRDFS